MNIFESKKKEMEQQQALEVLLGLSWSSKASLKKHCMLAYKGDIQKAKEAYEFLADGMDNLPDVDPVPPTMADQMKDMANGVVGWLGNNQSTIVDTFNTVRSMFGRAGAVAEETEEVTIEE
jgi:hypothetical protein